MLYKVSKKSKPNIETLKSEFQANIKFYQTKTMCFFVTAD